MFNGGFANGHGGGGFNGGWGGGGFNGGLFGEGFNGPKFAKPTAGPVPASVNRLAVAYHKHQDKAQELKTQALNAPHGSKENVDALHQAKHIVFQQFHFSRH